MCTTNSMKTEQWEDECVVTTMEIQVVHSELVFLSQLKPSDLGFVWIIMDIERKEIKKKERKIGIDMN